MQLIVAFLVFILIGLLFWFLGHTIRKELKINEENNLLGFLLNVGIGAACYLIFVNVLGNITKDFQLALFLTLIPFAVVIGFRFKDFKSICFDLRDNIQNNKIVETIKQNTDKYFWILIGAINFIYAVTAFSTTKIDRFLPGNTHIFNITQLLNDIYPPKYASLPNIDLRASHGADIFAGTISKLTGFHPEISLDLLTIVFLNLAFLTVYSLTVKFLNFNKLNKYLVPFAAFLAWGPVTQLFSKNPGEVIPNNLTEKLNYLTQTRLIDAAKGSGLVLHWFFDPTSAIGVFFFLISIYMAYRFFNEEQNLIFIILSSIFFSSLAISDLSKLAILLFGIILYILITSSFIQGSSEYSKAEIELIKKAGILIGISLILTFIYGNCLKFNKELIPFGELYKLGKSSLDAANAPLKTNILLLLVYCFGFYQAYKQKVKLLVFLLPFFGVSMILPYVMSMPLNASEKIIMSGNILGAFSLPYSVNYLLNRFEFKEARLKVFYVSVFLILGISTLMFFAFGEKEKPIFRVENGSLKYTGLQTIAAQALAKVNEDEMPFVSYLRSKKAKSEGIVSEKDLALALSTGTGLFSLLPPDIDTSTTISEQIKEKYRDDYNSSFALNSMFWSNKNLRWLYASPKVYRHMMPAEARKRLLIAYLNNGAKLALSNNKADRLDALKELYEINPNSLSHKSVKTNSTLLDQIISGEKKDIPLYIKEAALCPYFAIFNNISNDFDGDKIADIAFFDNEEGTWSIVYGNKQKEDETINLKTSLLMDYNGTDLFIPIPSDYDGDKKTDIALFNRTKGTWNVLKSSDGQIDSRIQSIRWCHPIGEVPVPADADGDSKTDNSCFDAAKNGPWHNYLTTTNNYFAHGFEFTPLDIPAHVDIDKDKKADYVIYKPDQESFNVYLSNCKAPNDTIIKTCAIFPASDVIMVKIGTHTSRVVPEDYDGDGFVDLATWSPETGIWEIAFAKNFLIKGATTSNAIPSNVKTLTLGGPGDIPMPGDYNGDGKAEAAVYHPDKSELEISTKEIINLEKYKNKTPASFIGI